MTAVEWLYDWMGKNQYFIGNDLLQAVEQAKVMEQKQSKLEQARVLTLEQLATLLKSAWTNGDWKAETYNEREMEKIMVELGYWNNGGGNPGNNTMTGENNMTGETTIEFPKYISVPVQERQPEPYNPNRPSLDTMTFKFEQESNCVDGSPCGGEGETLIVEAKSSLGIDGDGGAFYVLRTEQWAISDINDIIRTLKRVERAVEATNPTSIHVK